MVIFEFTKLLWTHAKSRSYICSGLRYWKTIGDLSLLIEVQQSSWDKAVYINAGATPTAFLVRPTPPDSGYWGISKRAESIEGPFQEQFQALSQDSDGQIEAAAFEEPALWLLERNEKLFGDPLELKQLLVHVSPEQRYAMFGAVHRLMLDWATDRLGSPADYFQGMAYYQES